MADLSAFRSLFPALDRVTYLNCATAGPAARPVLAAMRRAEDEWASGIFDWQSWEADAHATRALFARLVGASAEEVALLTTVSEGAATVARSLRDPGRILVGAREFRSNLFPWLALRARGFEVVELPAPDGVTRTEQFLDAIDERTRLVAVTEVQSSNGFRVDARAIAERCHAAGARLFLSVIHSAGVLRVDGTGADYVVAHGYKWLLSPRGASWLFVRRGLLDETEPLAASWKSVPEPYAEYYGTGAIATDARKLDASLAWFSWVGARAALELLLSLDAAAVEARALSLARAFREGARRTGRALVPEEMPTQVVGVVVPDPDALRTRLARDQVIAAVRGGYLRVGFHAFNDETDVERGLRALTVAP